MTTVDLEPEIMYGTGPNIMTERTRDTELGTGMRQAKSKSMKTRRNMDARGVMVNK